MKKKTTTHVSLNDLHTMPEPEIDWARIDALSDDDICEAVLNDPDAELLDEAFWKDAQVVLPIEMNTRTFFDADIFQFFDGKDLKGFQRRTNNALRVLMNQALEQQKSQQEKHS